MKKKTNFLNVACDQRRAFLDYHSPEKLKTEHLKAEDV